MKNLYDSDLSAVGNKALNLNSLYHKGFNVMPGYVLTSPEKDLELPFDNSIVRSNGLGEDGICSFSGIFESIQNVSRDELNSSIDSVWKSFSSKKYLAYSKIKKCSVVPGILIQEMVDSQYSAVAHVSADNIYIEHISGSCDLIVSGSRNPLISNISFSDDLSDYLLEFKFNDLVLILKNIYTLYNRPQEIEMTFDGSKWWVLQTKDLK